MHFYKNCLPIQNSIVFVKINKKIKSDSGTYVNLIEYDNIEAFVPNTELDKRVKVKEPYKHIVTWSKNFKTNKIYPMVVTTISPPIEPTINNQYTIDLSYKKVKPCERESYLEKCNIILKINKLADEFHEFTQIDKNIVYDMTIRYLFDNNNDNESDTFNPMDFAEKIYNKILTTPKYFIEKISKEYPNESQTYLEDLKTRILSVKKVVKQFFNLVILEENAVEKLKTLLTYKKAGYDIGYTASPKYHIIVTGVDDNDCAIKINDFINDMKSRINGMDCMFELVEQIVLKEQEYLLKYRKPNNIIIENISNESDENSEED